MYTVHTIKTSNDENNWPPAARPIRKQGRPGKEPRPVVCVRVRVKAKGGK